jgi:hypothetical protein
MTPGVYDFGVYRSGDTLRETPFQLYYKTGENKNPINLSGCTITCQFRKRPTAPASLTMSNTNYWIQVTNARNGEMLFKNIPLVLTPGLYYHDVQFTFPSGDIRTYIAGTILIESDIARP